MSRRRNGTNRAGAATGANPYWGGYKPQKKSATGAGTPSGAKENNSQTNYNIQIPVEQEKMEKILDLFCLALSINGFECRSKKRTGDLPTVIFDHYGNASHVSFDVYRNGHGLKEPCETRGIYLDSPLDQFERECESIRMWLEGIKGGLPDV